ncbi:MAG: GNAT family N-acetyltransferase [Gemmataceae bacterium]|nr:GNAT family N-acetyltransferase [Gemmataceae bacterium]
MSITYFKRFRMEIDLNELPPAATLPEGYFWMPWDESLLESHADVKFRSFCDEIDSIVFPSLSTFAGCQHLMREISRKPGFQPEATWLVGCPGGYCGTVQGVRERTELGAIQNLGITPEHRGRGLGGALLVQALHGFRRAGLDRAFLEVTAQNEGAIRLYRRLGFRCRKTIYKAVDGSGALRPPAGAGV